MSELQSNQKEVVGKDGKKRIYTFPSLTVRQSIKAEQLWSGLAVNYATANLSESCFEGIVWPLAEIMLTGAFITSADEAHRIDKLDESEYFRNNFEELLSAIKAGAETLGFRKAPEKEKEQGSAPSQEGKTTLPTSSQ